MGKAPALNLAHLSRPLQAFFGRADGCGLDLKILAEYLFLLGETVPRFGNFEPNECRVGI